MLNSIHEVNLEGLPRKRRKVLQYAKDFPDRVVLMRIEELALQLDLDPTTVVKACKAVGLTGFHELKQLLRKEVQLTNLDHIFSGFIQTMEAPRNPLEIARESMMFDLVTLHRTLEEIDMAVLMEIAHAIVKANRVVVIGLGHIGGIARFLVRLLRSVLPSVYGSTEYHGELFATMANFSEGDVVIGICLEKCQNQLLEAMAFAKEMGGVQTFGIVDRPNLPLETYTDRLLVIGGTESRFVGSTVAALSVSNAIFSAVAELMREKTVENFKLYRKLSDKENTYRQ